VTIAQVEIQIIAAVVAVACALPGVFLVLRKMALMSDALSHAILLGIVVAFFAVRNLESPILIVGAAVTGLLVVSAVEVLNRTKLLKEDAAIGLVFPALFSIGVILVSRFAEDVHLDVDAVLLGELAFAPFDRLILFGYDIGPRALVSMSVILLLNVIFLAVFYKELKLATFDPGLAAALGFAPGLIHYGLMAIVSVTAVGAFDSVGSILVVALMIAPPISAYLLTDKLFSMIAISAGIGLVSAVSGYWLARFLDASIAGSMATMTGLVFLLVFLFAPERGVVAQVRRRIRQRWEFAQMALAVHLYHHEDLPEATQECRIDHLSYHLRWDDQFADLVVKKGLQNRIILRQAESLVLTDSGRKLARQAMER
jgi:manganese/zinc/iron transport system permease protein